MWGWEVVPGEVREWGGVVDGGWGMCGSDCGAGLMCRTGGAVGGDVEEAGTRGGLYVSGRCSEEGATRVGGRVAVGGGEGGGGEGCGGLMGEIALAKGWLAVSENNKHGYERRKVGFWCEESGAGDTYYVQRAMIHYELETGLPFKLRHCWEILKDRSKWQEIAILNFITGSEGGSKRHKSSGSSSFNIESREASIHLNTTVGDNDEDEDALARLMVTEMTTHEKEERLASLDIKRREVECRERELEQQDMRFYLQPYDYLTEDQRKAMDEIKAKIKTKYNLQY
ncbi:hypothetical protein Tco_0689754 [Tanacetum coccineum]